MINKEKAKRHIDDIKSKGSAILDKVEVKSNEVKSKVKEIVNEGNARRIVVRKDGRQLAEFPLLLGGGGAAAAIVLAPTLTAIAAIAALASDITVVIERDAADSSDVEVIVKD